MNNYISIQDAIPRLQSEFNWFHSFIRELYFTTLRCYQRLQNDSGDDRVGEAGHLLHLPDAAALALETHAATQRENSEVDSARPADFSRMTSSPDSMRPPMPAKVSRISAWIAKNEARIE